MSALTAFETHEVFNQPPALEGHNLFTSDTALVDAASREGAAWAANDLAAYGAKLGLPETIEAGRLAHKFPPQLQLFDRFGHRIRSWA